MDLVQQAHELPQLGGQAAAGSAGPGALRALRATGAATGAGSGLQPAQQVAEDPPGGRLVLLRRRFRFRGTDRQSTCFCLLCLAALNYILALTRLLCLLGFNSYLLSGLPMHTSTSSARRPPRPTQ